MELEIEDAKKYFIVPFKDQESLYYVGGKKRLLALQIVMDEEDVIATTGVNTETCYLILNKTGDECQQLIDQMNEVMKKGEDASNKRESKKN